MPPISSAPNWFMVIFIFVLWTIATGLFGGLVWLSKRVLERIEAALSKLLEKHEDHEKRIATIEGRCAALSHTERRVVSPDQD